MMVELDAFERRFVRAYRSYLDEIEVEADPAAIARSVASGRQAFGWPALGVGRGLPELRLAVALLVVAALLIALGGVYLAGMRPPEPVTACPAGAQPNAAGAAGKPRPAPQEITWALAFDHSLDAVVLLDAAGTWAFDVCGNSWSRIGEGLPDTFPALAYDADSRVMLAADRDGGVWTFDGPGARWAAHRSAPWADAGPVVRNTFTRLVYDDASRDVLATWWDGPRVEIWSLDIDRDRWQPLWSGDVPWGAPTGDVPGYDPLMTWDAAADRLVVVRFAQRADASMVGDTWLFDPATATWSRGADAPGLNFGWLVTGAEFVYADGAAQSIAIGDGTAIGYDAAADRWQVLSGGEYRGYVAALPSGPTARLGHGLAYDRTNQRVVMVGGSYRMRTGEDITDITWTEATDVWAFIPASRQWVQLLEPAGS